MIENLLGYPNGISGSELATRGGAGAPVMTPGRVTAIIVNERLGV